MLLIETSYFITFLTLLSLAAGQLEPGNYYISDIGFGSEVLAAATSIPHSEVVIEPISDNRKDLEVWTFEHAGGENIFDIVLQRYGLFLSAVNNEVFISPSPFSWHVTSAGSGVYKISPANQQLIPDNLNADTNSGRPKANLAPASNSNTQRWSLRHV